MAGFDFLTMPGTKPATFTIDGQLDDDGKPREFTHHLRTLSGLEAIELNEQLSTAKMGLETDLERAKAGVFALSAAWEETLANHPDARVEGYTDAINALRGDELLAYFRGEAIPEDVGRERRKQVVMSLHEHKARAVLAYLQGARQPLEESFRGEAEGGAVAGDVVPAVDVGA